MASLSTNIVEFNSIRDNLYKVFGPDSKKLKEIIPHIDQMKDLLITLEQNNAILRTRIAEKDIYISKLEKGIVTGPQDISTAPVTKSTNKSYADAITLGPRKKPEVLKRKDKPVVTKRGLQKETEKREQRQGSEAVPKTGTVIIRSTEKKSGIEVRNLLAKAVNPSEVGIQIRKVFPVASQLIVKLPKQDDADKLKEYLLNKNIDNIEVREASIRLFPFIVFGVPNDKNEKDILEAIQAQFDTSVAEVKIRAKFPGPEGMNHWVIAAPHVLTTKIIKRKKLLLGFLSCLVRKYISIQRCFRCQRFGHLSYTCRLPEKCSNCGRDHNSETCNASKKCINCVRYNLMNTANWDPIMLPGKKHATPTRRPSGSRKRVSNGQIPQWRRKQKYQVK